MTHLKTHMIQHRRENEKSLCPVTAWPCK